MKVSELAESLTITADTVRFYTRNGFITPQKNQINGYRHYSDHDKSRLRFIVNARKLGFSVNDIEHILRQADHGGSACPLVRSLIEQRLQETEAQYQESKALREKMKIAISQWQSLPDKKPSNAMICHLIENFI